MADAVRDGVWFLEGGGQMAAAIQDFDWAATPLGPLEGWPASLKMVVSAVLNSRFPKSITWGPEFITIYNDAFRPLLGNKHEALGRSFKEIWQEAWTEVEPIVTRAYAGEATFARDLPLAIERNGYPEQAWFTFCYSPIRDEEGRIVGMMNTVMETTDKVVTERNARLLNEELSHRIKNILAMVSAIAHQTFHATSSKEDAEAALMRRISALGAAHDRLQASPTGRASVRSIIEGTLAPYRTGLGRFSFQGTEVDVAPRQALALALAINELATNAMKHGALSNDDGRVAIAWEAGLPETDSPFRLEWQESGGPTVSPPGRRGFGSRLIEHVLADSFSGEVNLTFAEKGLHFRLDTNMNNLRI